MKTFYEWLNESLNNEQNQAIKQLYVMIRDILFDLRNQMTQNNLTNFEDAGDWVDFCKKFRGDRVKGPDGNFIWNTFYKPSRYAVGWADKGCGIVVNIPDGIKNVFPNIRTPFYIRFPYEEDEMGGLVIYPDKTTDELRVSLKHLIQNFEGYKITIQHELQHLVDIGTDIDHSIDNVLIRTMNYQCHKGEISAYAKQYAYLYFKNFPNDSVLDFDKFKKTFYNNSNIPQAANLKNYINFGEDSDRIIKQYNLTPQQQQEMKNCYNSFLNLLKSSFSYFKNK
jgi:hypothetical protein